MAPAEGRAAYLVVVLAFVATLAVVYVMASTSGTLGLAMNGVSGTGTVDAPPDLIRDSDGNYYRAWVTYEDREGTTHRHYIRIPGGLSVGDEMFVLYDAENPETLDWRPRSDHIASVIIFPGIAVAVFGGLIILERRKRKRAYLSSPTNT